MKEALEEHCELEQSDAAKREFIRKLVTAVGAAAVAGLVANSAGAQVAEFPKVEIPGTAPREIKFDGTTMYKVTKHRTGFRLVLHGRELGNVLVASGVLPREANVDNSQITIEFTY